MKWYNKTKCPDSILKPLLVAAGKSVGARTSKVVVKVTQGMRYYSRGKAYRLNVVYGWHLRGRRKPSAVDRGAKGRCVETDGGYIQITLPKRRPPLLPRECLDVIELAQEFYKMAQHEWAHVRDFQSGTRFNVPRTPGGRRLAWRDRPIEISAMNHVDDAKELPVDNLVFELAVWLDR